MAYQKITLDLTFFQMMELEKLIGLNETGQFFVLAETDIKTGKLKVVAWEGVEAQAVHDALEAALRGDHNSGQNATGG